MIIRCGETKNMNESQIIDGITRYLDDDTYNYAVLIDGEWGSGKTYFVKKSLFSAINEYENRRSNRKVLYLSLYGCKDINDLKKQVVYKIVSKNSTEEKNNKIKKAAKTVVDKMGKVLLTKYEYAALAMDCVSDLIALKGFIYIFDDLERCDCPLNEVLGFLNKLVEHNGTKVIIVANEKEISSEVSSINIEQQYMLSLCKDVDWPKYERQTNSSKGEFVGEGNKLTFDEMEWRRKQLFPMQKSNEEYNRIKEKLIGITFSFESNVALIMENIIEQSSCEQDIKDVLKRNTAFYNKTMVKYEHHNLRTIQFFLSKVMFLLEQLKEVKIENDFRCQMEDYIVKRSFTSSVCFKSGKEEIEDIAITVQEEHIEKSKTIRDYVEHGRFDKKDYELDILEILEKEYRYKIVDDDPYSVLYNGYFELTQSECEEELEKLIIALEGDRYLPILYDRILIFSARLEKMGFPSSYTERIVSAMINNLQKNSRDSFAAEWYPIEDKEVQDKLSDYIQRINTELGQHSKNRNEEAVNDALMAGDIWVEQLFKIIRPNGGGPVADIPIFSLATSERWVKAITGSSSKTIYEFRRWLEMLYPNFMPRQSFSEDWPVMEDVLNSIPSENEQDLIKRQALVYLKCQIESIYKINTGKEYNMVESTG